MRRPDDNAEPTQAPRSRKGVQTRARLLEAAKGVFEDDGFLEARISDIAEQAGLSHGSFYHYFDSKEQVFREVAETQEEVLTLPPIDESELADRSDLPMYERIRQANRRYLERYRGAARIMGVIEEVSRYDARVNEARMRRQKHFAERSERSIRRLQQEGHADPDVDPALASVALGGMVGRFAELWLVQGFAAFDFDHAVDQLTKLWAQAIGLRDEPAP